MNELVKAEITDTGLAHIDELDEAQFFDQGRKLAAMEKGLQWAIGDWYNAIPWGDKKAACERVGLNYKTAEQYSKTARTFQIPTRVGILTFSHHRELITSDLTQDDRMKLLKKAAQEHWSGKRLKNERDIFLGKPQPAPTEGLVEGVEQLEKEVLKVMPKGIGKVAVNKVKSGLKKLANDMRHEFTDAVSKAAEEKSKVQRENMKAAQERADEQHEKTIKMAAGVKAFMTKAEFLTVRACLHPDKNSNPKAAEAFKIFNRLADVKNW